MKRYLVFGLCAYYPTGGWGDFQAAFETKVEAKRWIAENKDKAEWFEITDLVKEGIAHDCGIQTPEQTGV